MKRDKGWLTNLLEESMHTYYLENNPVMVEGIKKLLIAGENPKKIRDWCERTIGKCLTSICIGHMIDYVNKQIKN